MDNPPNTTMFTRAGSGTPPQKKDNVPVARALSDAATVIATALSSVVSTSLMHIASNILAQQKL